MVTNGWRAYGRIPQMQNEFDHRWINHRLWFVDGDDARVHTQNIENEWRQVKRDLSHTTNTSPDLFPTYLFAYMFKRYHGKENLFLQILEEIRVQYPVD